MIIVLVERDYSRPHDFQLSYIGNPCQSFADANAMMYTYISAMRERVYCTTFFVEDGTTVTVCNKDTGEVLYDYYLMRIN